MFAFIKCLNLYVYGKITRKGRTLPTPELYHIMKPFINDHPITPTLYSVATECIVTE
jgi:hypothetical protein